MSAARYEVLSTLPPGAGTRTRLAWQVGDAGFRRAVVMREVPEGVEAAPAGPAQEGVLPLLDMVALEGKRFAIYEFVPGATFAEVAAAHFSVDRLPSLGLIGRVVLDACRSIQRVHAWVDPLGLIGQQKHGGLSDASVFIGFDGVSRLLDMNARRSGKFIAPELTRGDVFDARADVFSLGALLHHATTRFEKGYAVTMARAPSPAEFPPPSTVHPEATPELDAVVMRALMPSPASRFSSAVQLAEELEHVLGPVIFTHAQVNTVLTPLFGDRMTALKELVDPKRRPPAPRPSAPRPSAPRASSTSLPRASAPPPPPKGNALDVMSALDIRLDGSDDADDDPEDLATQANVTLADLRRSAPPVPDYDPHATGPGKQSKPNFDPHATTPGLAMSSLNLKVTAGGGGKRSLQAEQEKARARGQEKISTADLDGDQLSPEMKSLQAEDLFDSGALGEGLEAPTNVKPRPSQAAMAALKPPPNPLNDDDGGAPDTNDAMPEADDDDEPVKTNRAPKILLALLLLAVVGGAAVVTVRPDVIALIKARLRPPPVPATVEELPFEDAVLEVDAGVAQAEVPAVAPVPVVAGATDAGEEDEGDGGEEDEDLVVLSGADGGKVQHDAGAGKQPAPQKKKKKKRSR